MTGCMTDRRISVEELAGVINTTWKAGGNILSPASPCRGARKSSTIMNKLLLANRIPHIMVFLDSPMAAGITEVYRRHAELFDRRCRV